MKYSNLLKSIKSIWKKIQKIWFEPLFLKLFTISCNPFWKFCNFIINRSFIPMLFPTFTTREKNSDFSIFHFISYRIHRSLTSWTPISRDFSINMARSKTKRTMISTGFFSFWDLFPTVKTGKIFVNRFHKCLLRKLKDAAILLVLERWEAL